MVELWQASLSMPLRTPGRVRTEDSEISADARTPGIQAPDTPDVEVNFSVEPKAYAEWTEAGLPPTLIDTLQSMEQGFEKANGAILGMHRDFSAMGASSRMTFTLLIVVWNECRPPSGPQDL